MKNVLILGCPSDANVERILAERSDIAVMSIATADEALAAARAGLVDLVIFGLEMPTMDLRGFVSSVRSESANRRTALVFLSASDEPELEQAEKYGVNAVIPPHADATRIEKILDMLLNVPERQTYNVLTRLKPKTTPNRIPFLFCVSVDVSTSGLLVQAAKSLNVGTLVDCSFFLPGNEQVTAEGRIVRTKQDGDDMNLYGVEFTKIDAQTRAAIESFIANQRAPKRRFINNAQ